MAGGLLGLLAAMWDARALGLAAPPRIPRLDAVGIDARVLGFTLGVTVLTGPDSRSVSRVRSWSPGRSPSSSTA